MSRPKRNPDERGIDWDLDECVMRDITPGSIAVYVNVDRQVTIVQGTNTVFVGSNDFPEFIRQLYVLARNELLKFPAFAPSEGKPKAQILRLTKDEPEPPAS
jgi:hypothetical protein